MSEHAEARVIPFPGPSVERTPPFSADAELAVLGGIMMDPDALARAMAIVKREHFHREAHRHLFDAMAELAASDPPVPIDYVTLPEQLRAAGKLESAGGLAGVSALMDAVPTAANIEYHAGIVRDLYTLRRLIETGTEVVRLGYDRDRSPGEAVAAAEGMIAALAYTDSRSHFHAFKALLWPEFAGLEERQKSDRDITGVASGFADVDRMTAGFQRGDLIIVAARPSMGKTSFVLRVAVHAALTEAIDVGFFSLEMSKESLVQRVLCAEARVDLSRFRRGRLDDDDYARLATAAGYLQNMRLHIDDTAGLSIVEFRARARKLKADVPNLGMIIVDYLQLMVGKGKSENRQQEVSEISRGLKALAKELSIPVVALSQLSRAVEQRPDKRPMMSDLRESGALEQDSDLVMFLYRPEYYFGPVDKQGNSLEGRAEMIIGKQRNGATGKIDLAFVKEFTRFESWTPRRRDDEPVLFTEDR